MVGVRVGAPLFVVIVPQRPSITVEEERVGWGVLHSPD